MCNNHGYLCLVNRTTLLKEIHQISWYQSLGALLFLLDLLDLVSSCSLFSSLFLSLFLFTSILMAAPPVHHERAFGVTNIKNYIPLILDLDDHNYDVWHELTVLPLMSLDTLMAQLFLLVTMKRSGSSLMA